MSVSALRELAALYESYRTDPTDPLVAQLLQTIAHQAEVEDLPKTAMIARVRIVRQALEAVEKHLR